MKRIFLKAFCIVVMLSAGLIFKVSGQSSQPTDAQLRQLVTKYLTTPVNRIQKTNGDVFLQRDMTSYLHQNVFAAPELPASALDKGHDHKSEQLLEFLNRPHPNVATINKYFNQAAAEFNVPVSILKAVAQVQSNWAQVSESMYGSWGVMGIIENGYTHQLTKAAALLNTDIASIKTDAKTNILAAAALLKWETSRETNSALYEVERSQDALLFSKIGTVTAAGNSSAGQFYSFTDFQPQPGLNYYRLKQVDKDGGFTYSPARVVRFGENLGAGVKYYPNPTNGILNIELDEQLVKESKIVNISTATGIMVTQWKLAANGQNVLQVDLSRFAKGIYFIQVKTSNFNSVHRIVLQ